MQYHCQQCRVVQKNAVQVKAMYGSKPTKSEQVKVKYWQRKARWYMETQEGNHRWSFKFHVTA